MIESGKLVVAIKPNTTTKCWQHFMGIKDPKSRKFLKGRSQCKHCETVYTFSQSNTTAILNENDKK